MKPKDYPKILIVSHAVFSDTSNSGIALSSIFRYWDPNAIAQIFCHTEVPKSKVCHRYFRITDFDVLKSVFTRRECGQEMINEVDKQPEDRANLNLTEIQQRIYEFGRKKYSCVILARDMIWELAKWQSAKMNQWIDEFTPDIIFLAAGEYKFIYRIGQTIAKYRRIPLVIYIGDDIYSICSFSISPFYWLERMLLRRTIKETVGSSTCFIANHEMLGKEYSHNFGIDYFVFPTSFPSSVIEPQVKEDLPLILLYTGGIISINRWVILRKIGEALSALNQNGQKAILIIYSSDHPNSKMRRLLNIKGAMMFKGRLTFSEVQSVISDSDILVHVESMDKVNRRLTRLSISTKIPQYLTSGKAILAVGPEEVSSIRYLKDNNSAMVITDLQMLKKELDILISDSELRLQLAKNALKLSQDQHDSDKNARLFLSHVRNIIR